MNERLVGVKMGERVVHTLSVSISDPLAERSDEAIRKKALEAAANSQVVANEEIEGLSATMHVSRRGPLEPDPNLLGVLAETKSGLEQVVRDRAYFLWDQAGRPGGRDDEFWHQAEHEGWRQRAYALWERAGLPREPRRRALEPHQNFEKT